MIAHEFSHVLNGDMRLSTRLIGLLFGLTVIAMIARTILRLGAARQRQRPQGRRRRSRVIYRRGARRARARLDRALLRPPDPGGGLAQPRVARRRLGRAVHARPARACATRWSRSARSAPARASSDADAEEVAHLLFAEGIRRAPSRRTRRSSSASARSTRSFQPSEFDAVRRRMSEARAMAEEEAAARAQPGRRGAAGCSQGAVVLAPAAVAGLVANPGTEHVAAGAGGAGVAAGIVPARGAPAGAGGGALRRARASTPRRKRANGSLPSSTSSSAASSTTR